MITSGIKNLIFDLGGVIINLSILRTYEAFSKLSGLSIEEISELTKSRKEFPDYETATLTSEGFRNFIRTSMKMQALDKDIDLAWNAMLLDIPIERLRILSKLKERFNTFLLSNTNEMHLMAFTKILFKTVITEDFTSYFTKVYYSHELGLRKPDRAIYDFVLKENNLTANETLFFDDTLVNLAGAAAVGVHTFHVTDADEFFKKLDKIQ